MLTSRISRLVSSRHLLRAALVKRLAVLTILLLMSLRILMQVLDRLLKILFLQQLVHFRVIQNNVKVNGGDNSIHVVVLYMMYFV